MWFKVHSQIGFCYVQMNEHHAAVQTFHTALEDPTAQQQDVCDVLYALGRSLETIGKVGQALEVYHRVSHVTPTFRDVANRLRELERRPRQSSDKGQSVDETHSWLSSVVDNVHRLLIGSQK